MLQDAVMWNCSNLAHELETVFSEEKSSHAQLLRSNKSQISQKRKWKC